MGVFDSLVILTPPEAPDVEITRTVGPIERGSFKDAAWVPSPGPQRVNVDGFGIDGGNPYYDIAGASPGQAAVLWIDPDNATLWLEAR